MRIDPIEFEILKNLFVSIAEEMGVTLCRTAFSPNIKERLDYSCAIYDAAGETIAQGDHMPVHLGAMPLSVRAAIDHVRMDPGDVVILNDPFRGGTHLPDITLVSPVFLGRPFEKRKAGVLRREPGASLRRRRHEPRIDAARQRSLPGRIDHPANQAGAPRRDCCRCARVDHGERADARRTRGRPHRADCRQPRRGARGCGRLSRNTGGSASMATRPPRRITPSACCVIPSRRFRTANTATKTRWMTMGSATGR